MNEIDISEMRKAYEELDNIHIKHAKRMYWVGIGVLTWIVLTIVLAILYILGIEWAMTAMDIIALVGSFAVVVLCSFSWFSFYKRSIKAEKEQSKVKEQIEDDWFPWFDHKRARTQMGMLYAVCIALNLLAIIWNIQSLLD